jgi:hypothetical protein
VLGDVKRHGSRNIDPRPRGEAELEAR